MNPIPYDLLWYVSLAECKDELMREEKYGYGLIKRKIKEFMPYNRETMKRHQWLYRFFLDLYSYKLLRGEGFHWPISQMEPRWEMEIARDWWYAFFNFGRKGSKSERSPIYFD